MLRRLDNNRTLIGVPNRDLTEDEARFYEEKFGWPEGSILENSGCYEFVEGGQTEQEARELASSLETENGENE